MSKKELIRRTCPECGMSFTDKSCPGCKWQPKDKPFQTNVRYCAKCHAQTLHKYKGQPLCIDCYQDEIGKPENYVCTATSEQISKFLIKEGSKSIHWLKATPEQRQAAIDYYKTGVSK